MNGSGQCPAPDDPMCPECDQPMLPVGAVRQDPHDYRHARGCPRMSASEHRMTELLWKTLEKRKAK
jgi:hypothetical protein